MSRDRKIIFVLIVALAVQVFLLLAHTGVIHLSRTVNPDGVQAGHVVQAQNYLRRRSVNSLVWETSQAKEPVYFHDSILTLKGSTATLELHTATEVTLSENTLITIEPPDDYDSGEIRLRFKHGNLQARNPYANSTIEGPSWSVGLKNGSDIELREIGDAGVEVRLKGGRGTVQAANGSTELKPDQILRLTAAGTEQLLVNSALKWLHPPHKRIYLHGDAVPVQVEFEGEPDSLIVQTLGWSEKTLPLPKGGKNYMADLSHGNHRLYLRKGNETSVGMDIQVWRAPLIHLLSPLPRNRADIGQQIPFLWQKSDFVEKFRLHVTGAGTAVTREIQDNTFTTSFSSEGDAQWFVEGVDKEGYVVPPLYRYPLYIREKPFEAPKLRKPELRAPAKAPPGPGAWLWSWIMPNAHADTMKFEAVFSWEPITGASHYIIEISESADFRDPVVNTAVKTTEFVWNNPHMQTYYWRVAAGSKKRMGMFSPPESVDFTPLKSNSALAAVDGVVIRKIESSPAVQDEAPPPPTPANPPQPPSFAPPAPEQEMVSAVQLSEAQQKWRPALLWHPRYGSTHAYGTEKSEATLNGATLMSFGLEIPWRNAEGAIWLFDAGMTKYSFKPDPREKYPFQKDLNWLDIDLNLLRFRSRFGYGLTARQSLSVRRKDYETIEAGTALGFGPVVQWNFPLKRGEMNVRAAVVFINDGQALMITPEWRTHITSRIIFGLSIVSQAMFEASNVGYSVQGFGNLGISF